MLVLVVLSVALGYTYPTDRNALVPPTVYTWPQSPPAAPDVISLAELKARLDSGSRIVLLDARAAGEYEAGHIRGAFNLPPARFEERYPAIRSSLKDLSAESELIVYCGGPGCELDRRLADLLFSQGHRLVKVFTGGWTAWVEAGYLKEAGASR